MACILNVPNDRNVVHVANCNGFSTMQPRRGYIQDFDRIFVINAIQSRYMQRVSLVEMPIFNETFRHVFQSSSPIIAVVRVFRVEKLTRRNDLLFFSPLSL